jgi:hypothetical protein
MKVKELIATILVVSMMNLACFIAGAKIGQKVNKDEPIEIPKVEPLKAFREHQDRKEAEREQNRIGTIMENIEKYDGTSYGQKDVPRG